MHRYMRAIGYSKGMSRKDYMHFLEQVQATAETVCVWAENEEKVHAHMEKEIAPGMGICLLGEYGEEDGFFLDHAFPYFKGHNLPEYDQVLVERHADKESYSGICENLCTGLNVIYHLQNPVEYMKYIKGTKEEEAVLAVTLSGLSVEGKILLPVESASPTRPVWTANHQQMIQQARNGDEKARENLALEDMDMYAALSRRVKKEDLYSIVDSYFIPYGIECDHYSVMGNIEEMETVENKYTGETLYLLTLRCNELEFEVCINQKDLLGVPEEGRRFKGIVWMQGQVSRT